MKRAFTLIELIVVIGILGVLMGIMVVSFSGSTESARAAQCQANLRNLAAACQTYASVDGHYPLAGSIETMKIDESDGITRAKALYREVPGWISWASRGVYAHSPRSHQASASWMISTFSTDPEERTYCLTNGALWKYVSGNRQCFVCADHVKKFPKNPPLWSYVMNAYFGWDSSRGGTAQGENYGRIWYRGLERADRYLLFAELQYLDCGLKILDDSASGTDADTVLQYSATGDGVSGDKNQNTSVESSGNETIGVNHKRGRNLFAHVAFADGHVESLRIPYTGTIKKPQVDESMLRRLTGWLCEGKDVSFDNKQYKLMNN